MAKKNTKLSKKGVASPSSTGPAGANLEANIGAFYNLAMLSGSEPLGLSGTTIECVALQRAALGYPLDDIIIHAKTHDGKPATLEIQAKRKLKFTPEDKKFGEVVAQIFQASLKKEFKTEVYEMAIAVGQTSRKISEYYQAVLDWAKKSANGNDFFARISQTGLANDEMRTFVNTFKRRIIEAGGTDDNETIWQLLRKLTILVFDFNTPGSNSEQSAINQAFNILHRDQKSQARSFWEVLIILTSNAAAVGGSYTRLTLLEELRLRAFLFSGYKDYLSAYDSLKEGTDYALKSITDQIGNITLMREKYFTAIQRALDKGRYIEIQGDGGVGKSVLLKQFASEQMKKSRAIVFRPGRTTPRGWTALKAELQFKGSAKELLTDFASQGGATIFIDNLDFFNDEERTTIIDLVQAAADVQGVYVIATARRNFGKEEKNWLPSDALKRLGCIHILIDNLSEPEIEEIQHAIPELAPLMMIGHPACEAQTLFRLAYLARRPKNAKGVFSETEMAFEWWNTVDGLFPKNLREIHRVLNILVQQSLGDLRPFDISEQSTNIIDLLIREGILRDLGNERVTFDHDVFREWGIANFLYNNLSTVTFLHLERPARPDLARGIELASRMLLETSNDFSKWKQLVDILNQQNVHHTWRRKVLLGLVHSEIADKLLQDHKVSTFLLANDASILGEIIGTLMATETVPASDLLVNQGVPKQLIPPGFHIPIGPSWNRVITWLLTVDQKLPGEAILQVIKLYITWCEGRLGKGSNIPLVLKSLYRWLIEIETTRLFENSDDCAKPFCHSLDHNLQMELESDLRRVFLAFCDQVPQLAMEYLQILGKRRKSDDAIISVLTFRGVLAQVTPEKLADLTAKILIHERNGDNIHRIDPFDGPFDHSFDCILSPASPAQGPFLELLTYAPHNGLSLIRQLCEHAASFFQETSCDDTIVVDFTDGSKKFLWQASYGWSRGSSFSILASAFMALEAWSHKRIEAGEDIEKVLADLLGPADSPAAYLLVAVDILISHWPKTQELAIPFIACPELLALDTWRLAHDRTSPSFSNFFLLSKEPSGATNLSSLQNRPSRRASLLDLIGLYAINELHTETLRSHLKKAIERVGHPDESSKMGDPRLMAYRALNRANPANWVEVQRKNSDSTDVEYQYVPPIDETQWLSKLKANQKTDVRPIPKRQEYSTKDSDEIKALLQAVVSGLPELAEKAVSIMDSLSINKNLSRSLMRCALAGCVLPKRDAMTLEEEFTSRLEHHHQSMVKIVDAELAWHADKQPEPEWPSFSLNSQANEYVNHQRAALWFRASQNLQNPSKQSLLLDIVRFYAQWTAKANEVTAKDSYIEPFYLKEWNNEYFKLVAQCIPKLTLEEIEQLALIPITGLTEEAFFNVLPSFLECIDNAYFHEELEELAAINIRSRLADRLMATNGWKRLKNSNSHSIETQIKPAIASLFFNICVLFEPPASYFEESAIHRIDPFLPTIEKLIVTGPSLHVAIFFLNLIENVPQAKYTAHILNAANCWLKKFPEDGFFWIDHEIGRRVCEWIEKTKNQPSNPLHTDRTLQHALDQLSGKLIKIGVPEANSLEKLASSLAT